MIYGINSPDFFDRLLFRDFINNALECEYLVKNEQLQLEFKPGFNYANLDLRNLLSTEVRSSILSLIKANPH
jgi:glycerol-3-phosphate O-acyltransferase